MHEMEVPAQEHNCLVQVQEQEQVQASALEVQDILHMHHKKEGGGEPYT